jgi:MFS family permease
MKSNYGWVVVGVGALMTCVGFGAVFSLAVLLQPMGEATGWSRAGISSAMTLVFLTMGIAGFGWGALSDRFGARICVLAGTILLGLGLFLASRATTLLQFQLTYGVLVGVAAGSFFAPMIGTVTNWFEKHRGIAVSLVSTGVGVAPLTMSPLVSWLIATHDWRTTQMIVAVLALVLMIPAALLVRSAPAPADTATAQGGASQDRLSVSTALQSPQFLVLALTFFACCAMHSGPIFHTISYAMWCGIPAMAAVSIYSIEGLAGLGGRIVLGLLADRLGVKPVIVGALLLQAVAAGSFLFASSLYGFYAVASVFGFAYGGVMPLYAVLARGYFGPHIIGTVFGAATMVSSLGMALGPVVGGWIYDTYNAYTWLYIGSFAIGLGAAAIALAFPKLPVRARPQLQPA